MNALYVTCQRTGRTWPREHQVNLRTCVLCKGYIDIRNESWRGDPDGSNPKHGGECPPARDAGSPETAATATPNVAALKPKVTGRELLSRNAWWVSQHPDYAAE